MNILDYLFPRHCVGCGKQGSYFCAKCLETIKKVKQICPVCEKPTPFGQTHEFCKNKYSLDGLFSFFAYEGVIRLAIHKLKYRLVTDLKDDLWKTIDNGWQQKEEETIVLKKFMEVEKPIIVPIPLYWHKENIRGFNQALLFGKEFSSKFNLGFSDKIIVRTKNVPSQTKLTQKEREENVKGIFTINSVSLRSRRQAGEAISVILVDDVWTTGATLKEATRILKEGGVKKVWGLTIAR